MDDQTTRRWRQSLSFAYSESDFLSFDPVAQDLTRPDTPPISQPFSQIDAGGVRSDRSDYFNNHYRRRGLRYQTDLADIAPLRGHFITAGIEYEEERAVLDSGFAATSRVAPMRRNAGVPPGSIRLHVASGHQRRSPRRKQPGQGPLGLLKALNDLGSQPYDSKVGFGTEVMSKVGALLLLRRAGLQSQRGPTRLRVNYGEGIKAPTMIEAFSQNNLLLGNPELKPERSRSFDIGIEQFFWKDRLRVEGVYFKNRFRDQIAFIADPATSGGPVRLPDGRMTNFINNDRATARASSSVSTRPNRWLRFDGATRCSTRISTPRPTCSIPPRGLSFLNPEVGLPLYRRPRHSGSASVAFIGGKFDANLDGVFTGKRRDYDPAFFSRFDGQGRPIYNGGYTKLDLAGSYRLSPLVSLFGRIENLLNQDYEEVLGYPAYRLNFSAGMRFRIGGGNNEPPRGQERG